MRDYKKCFIVPLLKPYKFVKKFFKREIFKTIVEKA